MRYYLITGVLLFLFASCGSADPSLRAEKAEQTKALVEHGDFEITLNWAHPLLTSEMSQLANSNLLPIDSRAGRINLTGSGSYIRKQGDSLDVYLPYYGTRQLAPVMGDNNVAIEFEGEPDNYELTHNEAKGRYDVSFSMKERSERYNVNITITAGKRATVRVNSSQRTSIRYTGEVRVLKEN